MTTYDTGVLVGRFQVAELTEGHRQVIEEAQTLCNNLVIFLGLSPCVTKRNPLDFQTRKLMLQEAYPSVKVLYIKDLPDDSKWSKHLDHQLSLILPSTHSIVLIGSRDSFISSYDGSHDTYAIESKVFTTGTEQRNKCSKAVKESPDFRAGQVYHAYSRHDTVFPTVDMLVKTKDQHVLLVKKEEDSGYRLPGGFLSTTDTSLEEAAVRELQEETGLEVDQNLIGYLLSHQVNDWRYQKEFEKILTTVFIVTLDHIAKIRGADDVAEAIWAPIDSIGKDISLVPEHQDLWDKFKTTSRIKFM